MTPNDHPTYMIKQKVNNNPKPSGLGVSVSVEEMSLYFLGGYPLPYFGDVPDYTYKLPVNDECTCVFDPNFDSSRNFPSYLINVTFTGPPI